MAARDFIGLYAALKKAERETFNQSLKAAAFTAWRVEVSLSSLMGGQEKITYTDYCDRMGLLSEEEKKQNAAMKEIQKLQNRYIAQEASERADEIMRIDKLNRQNSSKGG